MQTRTSAEAPGGFLWWYCDLRKGRGDGLVLIWSLGLPFLPGSRIPGSAIDHPALSVAHYRGGLQEFYLLQQYDAADADLDLITGAGRLGASHYSVQSDEERIEVLLQLDEPVPQSAQRLQAEIRLGGPRVALTEGPASAVHLWSPRFLHGTGRATLTYDDETHRFEGSAYFDGNSSSLPLHQQDVLSWRWGRVSFRHSTIVYYEVQAEDGSCQRFLLEQNDQGQSARIAGRLHFFGETRGHYGLRRPRETHILTENRRIVVLQDQSVEDGPFYSRTLCRAIDESGNHGVGVSEVVRPTHVDRPWQRPLVRMRTHRVGHRNSPFLPLFNGTRSGRAARTLQALLGGTA